MGGDQSAGWLILKNGSTVIGLFQGMFEKNILTFNPGWDQSASPLASFTDVREVQKSLDAQDVEITTRADPDIRVVYTVRLRRGVIVLLTLYSKNVQDNIPPHVLRSIAEELDHDQ